MTMRRRKAMIGAALAAIVSASAAAAGEDAALRVQTDGRALHVSTRDGTSRSDCMVYLHDGFRASIDEIPAGRAAVVDLRAFVANGTLRFAPGIDRLSRVHVICRKPQQGDALFRLD